MELAKSWLDAVDTAREVFNGSNIHITTDGHRYLGGVIGFEALNNSYNKRCRIGFLIQKLLSHNLMQLICLLSWLIISVELFFQMCTSSSCLFQPLEDIIGSAFIPKLLGHDIPGKVESDLLSLPV